MGALRRVRAYGGHFTLIAVLTMVTALLISGVPRIANRLTEEGLRKHLAAQSSGQRDLLYETDSADLGNRPVDWPSHQLDGLYGTMPPAVRDVIADRWYAVQTPFGLARGADLARAKVGVDLAIRTTSGLTEAATLVEGRWPEEHRLSSDKLRPGPVELAFAADVAAQLGLRVGSRLGLALPGPAPGTEQLRAQAVVVGVFRPHDAGAGIWDSLPTPLRVAAPPGDGPYLAVALTSQGMVRSLNWPMRFSWRYRVDPAKVDVRELDRLVEAVDDVANNPPPPPIRLSQGLNRSLHSFVDSLRATRTLLAVISAGVLATLAGLIGLAAALAVRRRRAEFALIRARGGASGTLIGRSLAESLLVIPIAMVLGWYAGTLVPGAPGSTEAAVLAVAVLTTLALPLAAVLAAPEAGRRDLVRVRPSVRRLTAEVTVLVVAVLAAVLLRRRGLPSDGSVDPLLVSVPVLLAAAAALVALRVYPWPLRLVESVAARARGSVLFLGTARAGRSSVTAPLIVVVVAVATAAFCGVVAGGIADGRERAAAWAVPGDLLVTGDGFAPDTTARLAEVPGVRAVTPLLSQSNQTIHPDTRTPEALGDVSVLLVDAEAYRRVVADSGAGVPVPAELAGAPVGGPLPAVVSPALAADLAAMKLPGTFVTVQGGRYEFRVAGTAANLPLLPAGGRFLVLPWPARPAHAEKPLTPTGFLLAGTGADQAALRRVADEGQHRYHDTGLVTGGQTQRGSELRSRAAVLDELSSRGANGLLAFAFGVGTASAVLLGLLAIAFAVLAGARTRGQVLSRLRTLGLSRPQWRGLLAIELAPLVAVSLLTGAVVGVLLPALLTPVLGLSRFTGGTPVPVRFQPGLVAGIVALGALALGLAIAVEALNNRRMRLGEVLRLGEES